MDYFIDFYSWIKPSHLMWSLVAAIKSYTRFDPEEEIIINGLTLSFEATRESQTWVGKLKSFLI